jgi:hypothetical protein
VNAVLLSGTRGRITGLGLGLLAFRHGSLAMLFRFAINRSARFLFPSPARFSAASSPPGNFVTGAICRDD